MKLSDLRRCDGCHGPLLKPGMATWHVVRVSQAMLDPKAVGRTMGLAQFFGEGDAKRPGAFALAEVFSDRSEDAWMILGDKDKALWTELFLCFDCYALGRRPLASVAEQRSEEEAEAEARR